MSRLCLATSNPGKARELNSMLAELGLEVVPQSALDIPEPAETAPTFVENALIKARNAAQRSGLPAVADDSGLVVDALNGAPGIYSSRFAGDSANDQDNLNRLLGLLADTPSGQRTARFQCVAVYMTQPSDPTPLIYQGIWTGEILFEPRGAGGFGYDPVFYVPAYSCSAAELSTAVKNRVSHRGQALSQLVAALKQGKPN